MKKKLAICVDMQKDFTTGSLANPRAVRIIPAVVSRVSQSLDSDDEDVLATADCHDKETYLITQEGINLPVIHTIPGTEGFELVDELAILFNSTWGSNKTNDLVQEWGTAYDSRIFKKGTFGSIPLAMYVQKMGYREVELFGTVAEICVVANAMAIKLFNPEVVVRVRTSCCAGLSEEAEEATYTVLRANKIEVI